MAKKYKFDFSIETINEKWVSITYLTDLKQKKEFGSSVYFGEESEKEKETHRLIQKAKEMKKYYSSVYQLIPFKKTIEFEIRSGFKVNKLMLYYKNEAILITKKYKKKKQILEKINLINLKKNRW